MQNAIETISAPLKASNKYLFINTQEVVNKFLDQGYEVKSYKQARTYSPEKVGYQTHIVELVNKNLFIDFLDSYAQTV
jgi:hypothetical protein